MAVLHISQNFSVVQNLCGTSLEVAVHLKLNGHWKMCAPFHLYDLERFLPNETSVRINHVGSTSLQSVLAIFVAGA